MAASIDAIKEERICCGARAAINGADKANEERSRIPERASVMCNKRFSVRLRNAFSRAGRNMDPVAPPRAAHCSDRSRNLPISTERWGVWHVCIRYLRCVGAHSVRSPPSTTDDPPRKPRGHGPPATPVVVALWVGVCLHHRGRGDGPQPTVGSGPGSYLHLHFASDSRYVKPWLVGVYRRSLAPPQYVHP